MFKRKTRSNFAFLIICLYLIYARFKHMASARYNRSVDKFFIFSQSSSVDTEKGPYPQIKTPSPAEADIVDPVTLVHNYKKIEQRFVNRRAHLRDYCNRKTNNILQLGEGILQNVIADEELPSADQTNFTSFFGCIPPESGSTIFHAWWWDIYQPDREFTRQARIDNQSKIRSMTMATLEKLASSSKSIKFLVVRHPLTRFVSNWDDHFCTGCGTGADIIAQNSEMDSFVHSSTDNDYQIGFKQLVNFVNINGISFDVHFNTQHNECVPCDVTYDYIVKLESIHEDIQYLMARLNRPDNTKELISHETIAKNKNANLYKNYFNMLTTAEIRRLVSLYQNDFDLFNYTFDFKSKTIGGWD